MSLDAVAKLGETAAILCAQEWGSEVEYPPPFGRAAYPEDKLIRDMDARTGASLKLTIVNETGRVWTMVAGELRRVLRVAHNGRDLRVCGDSPDADAEVQAPRRQVPDHWW